MSFPVLPHGFLGAQGDSDTYRIERSLRFNPSDSAYLSRTFGVPTEQNKWTLSFWCKRTPSGSSQDILGIGSANLQILFWTDDTFSFYYVTTHRIKTNQVFRDPSAWQHFVLACDFANATASNRIRLYVNGVEVTSFSVDNRASTTSTPVNSNGESHALGSALTPSSFLNGYMAEVYFIDGQQLSPSSFGETDSSTGRWRAKAYSGTYGNNGFQLKFADNSGTTATTLGKDSSGNGNNWTPNNFSVTSGAGNDSLVDSPTNYGTDTGLGGEVRGNYSALNPIAKLAQTATYSNGGLNASGSDATALSGIAVSSGKWYAECTYSTVKAADNIVGVQSLHIFNTSSAPSPLRVAGSVGYDNLGGSTSKVVDNSFSTYGASWTSNDVIGVALNLDDNQITFYKNGSSQGAINYTFSNYGPWAFANGVGGAAASIAYSWNFGQRPFAYTAPSGFKALCTTNLPTPVIKKPSSAMDVVTYTGTGASQSISSLGFSPDLVWIKGRSGATDHAIYDTTRGVQRDLGSNLTTDETTQTQGVTSFNSAGFTIGTLAKLNTNTSTYVAWAWDEAATDGLDIISYTGNGANRTISHNLGVAPKMIIIKARTTAGTDQGWPVYHSSLANTEYLLLNSTAAKATGADYWNSTSPTASVFSLGTNSAVNTNNDTYIAYAFSEVEGFSKIGSYTGNGSADGPFIWCGFRPKFVIFKHQTNASAGWRIFDSTRSQFNVASVSLAPDANSIESSVSIDFVSSGIKIRDSVAFVNASAGYIFAAFAESPFKYANAR